MEFKIDYFCAKLIIMVVTIKKGIGRKKLDEALKNIKHTKKLEAKLHLGKVKWHEDALAYQKRLRDEWD